MRPALLSLLVVAAAAVPAAAVDIVLHDGTLIDAASYTLTGSYLMLTLADGRQVAYDLADVDVEHLKAQEAAAATDEAPGDTRLRRETIRDATASTALSSFTLTDDDVEHVGATAAAAARAAEEEEAADSGELPEGVNEGGRVDLQAVRTTEVEGGVWEVSGEVVNRSPGMASSVRVELELLSGSGTVLESAAVPVADLIEAGKKAPFSHRFEVAEKPTIRARVLWMGVGPGGAGPSASGEAAGGAPQEPDIPDL